LLITLELTLSMTSAEQGNHRPQLPRYFGGGSLSRASRISPVIGLGTSRSKPACFGLPWSLGWLYPETAMRRVWCNRGSARKARATAYPSMPPGSPRSQRTRSGGVAKAQPNADCPSYATSTSKPIRSLSSAKAPANSLLSSMSKTRLRTFRRGCSAGGAVVADRAASGNVSVNAAPRPGPGLSPASEPPCSSASFLLVARPSPSPPLNWSMCCSQSIRRHFSHPPISSPKSAALCGPPYPLAASQSRVMTLHQVAEYQDCSLRHGAPVGGEGRPLDISVHQDGRRMNRR
jgi:hypothetical protein